MKKKVKKKRTKHEDLYYLFPLVFIIGVVPLIVRFVYIPLDGIAKQYWPSPYDADFCTYWKAICMEIASVMLFFLGYINIRKNKIEIKKIFFLIPIAIYAFFVILSSLTSEYKDIAFFGFPDRHEGMFVILTYLFIATSTILLVNSETHVKLLIGALITSATIIGIIGILQYFGYDFMKSDTVVKTFIIPAMYYKMGQITMSFRGSGIDSTLDNPNFVGSYMAMVFPLSIVFLILFKHRYLKIFMGIFGCLMLVNLLGCRSRAGYMGTALALVFIIIMLRNFFIKYWLYAIVTVLSSIPAVFMIDYGSSYGFIDQFISLKKDVKRYFDIRKDGKYLKDIVIFENKVTIVTSENSISFFMDNNKMYFKDKIGNDIPHKKWHYNMETVIVFENDLYNDYTFILKHSKNIIEVEKSGYSFRFKFTNQGIRFIDVAGQLREIKPVEKVDIAGMENLGSGRLFIWSRTIPLLKKTIFTGFGPGTFAMYFPQTDFVGKLLDKGQALLVEKPHNLYLDIGVSTGLISLLSFMTLIGMYFVSSIRLYMRNDFQSFYAIVGVGLFSAIVGYLVAGLFNDSVVPVAPVFWILFGLGICINLILTNKGDEPPIGQTSATKRRPNNGHRASRRPSRALRSRPQLVVED